MRFRPIMMTTLAALLGALPLVLESGTGSELRLPLGVSVVGGLLLSQVITLYTTPVDLPGDGGGARLRHPPGAAGAARCRRNSGVDLRTLHPPADRHRAAGDRRRAGRAGRLFQPAGGAAAERRPADHRRLRQPARRRSGDHGLLRRRAAGAPARGHRRRLRDDLDLLARQHQHRRAVRPLPQRRGRGAGRAGGDQRAPAATCRPASPPRPISARPIRAMRRCSSCRWPRRPSPPARSTTRPTASWRRASPRCRGVAQVIIAGAEQPADPRDGGPGRGQGRGRRPRGAAPAPSPPTTSPRRPG